MIGSEPGPSQSTKPEATNVGGGSAGFPKATSSPPQKAPQKKPQKHSNLRTDTPPSPAMFSHDSNSADEDENILLQTGEWRYPKPQGRQLRTFRKKLFGNPNKEIVIVLCVHSQSEENACGAYDESFVPLPQANALVSNWEVYLRRLAIFLCAWSDQIVPPKILRKYIEKNNRDWVKLYRYTWLKSQSNHLCVFPSPKVFALATCLDCHAEKKERDQVINETTLPKGADPNAFELTGIKAESTIIVSDLPFPIDPFRLNFTF